MPSQFRFGLAILFVSDLQVLARSICCQAGASIGRGFVIPCDQHHERSTFLEPCICDPANAGRVANRAAAVAGARDHEAALRDV
jgi:hypothetical protein